VSSPRGREPAFSQSASAPNDPCRVSSRAPAPSRGSKDRTDAVLECCVLSELDQERVVRNRARVGHALIRRGRAGVVMPWDNEDLRFASTFGIPIVHVVNPRPPVLTRTCQERIGPRLLGKRSRAHKQTSVGCLFEALTCKPKARISTGKAFSRKSKTFLTALPASGSDFKASVERCSAMGSISKVSR
jgi:hypothetical protein